MSLVASVSVMPGATALTVTWSGPASLAIALVIATSAPFDET
jgi:hypothetical protein